MSKRAIAYCRVSTVGQADNGVSLEGQRARIESWSAVNGYILAGLHVDAGLSGGRADNRPALQDALAEACKTKGALVVYSLSRLARSTKDTLAIGERLSAAGADLVSLSENIDTTSAAGKMVFRMLAVLSEFERDLVSERTAAAMAHKRLKGERIGTVPYGFDLRSDGVHLRPNPDEQRVVAQIQAARAEGRTYREIAGSLTARGVPTKNGGRWSAKVVWAVCGRTRMTAPPRLLG